MLLTYFNLQYINKMHNVTHAAQRMLLIKTASRAFALASVTVLVLAFIMFYVIKAYIIITFYFKLF